MNNANWKLRLLDANARKVSIKPHTSILNCPSMFYQVKLHVHQKTTSRVLRCTQITKHVLGKYFPTTWSIIWQEITALYRKHNQRILHAHFGQSCPKTYTCIAIIYSGKINCIRSLSETATCDATHGQRCYLTSDMAHDMQVISDFHFLVYVGLCFHRSLCWKCQQKRFELGHCAGKVWWSKKNPILPADIYIHTPYI